MLTGSAIISLTIFYWKWLALNFQLQFTVHTCILNWGSLECKVKWSPSPKTSSLLPYKDRKPGNLWQTVPRLCVLSLWKVLLSLPEFRQLFTLTQPWQNPLWAPLCITIPFSLPNTCDRNLAKARRKSAAWKRPRMCPWVTARERLWEHERQTKNSFQENNVTETEVTLNSWHHKYYNKRELERMKWDEIGSKKLRE